MGTLTLSTSTIYLDTVTIIYSVERHVDYYPLLQPLWRAVKARQVEVISSELALLETLVMPLRLQDQLLINAYEQALTQAELGLAAISPDILRRAAQLRADVKLKTPDAIHAATALVLGCTQFITNANQGFNLVWRIKDLRGSLSDATNSRSRKSFGINEPSIQPLIRITNDGAFRRVPGLNVTVLHEII